MLLNPSLCTTTFGPLRPEKCPQGYTNTSGKPAIEPSQEQRQGEEDSLPLRGQDEIISRVQVAEDGHNEVHPGQTSKLQEVPEETKMETLSSKDEHLQTWAFWCESRSLYTPVCTLQSSDCALPGVFSVQTKTLYCMPVIHILETKRTVV